VLKLHTKLGKPIPSDNPTVIPPASSAPPPAAPALKKVPMAMAKTTSTFVKPAIPPKVNFVSGKTEFDRFLHTDPLAARNNSNPESPSSESLCTTYPASTTGMEPATPTTPSSTGSEESSTSPDQMYLEKDIEPVGMDYIEEIRTEDGNENDCVCVVTNVVKGLLEVFTSFHFN